MTTLGRAYSGWCHQGSRNQYGLIHDWDRSVRGLRYAHSSFKGWIEYGRGRRV